MLLYSQDQRAQVQLIVIHLITMIHIYIRDPVQKAGMDTTNKAVKLKKNAKVKVKAKAKVTKVTRRK